MEIKDEKGVEITEQDEFNPSLAAMEEEVKPQSNLNYQLALQRLYKIN